MVVVPRSFIAEHFNLIDIMDGGCVLMIYRCRHCERCWIMGIWVNLIDQCLEHLREHHAIEPQ